LRKKFLRLCGDIPLSQTMGKNVRLEDSWWEWMDAHTDRQTDGQIIAWSVIYFIGLLLKSTNVNEILKESFCSIFACLSYGYVRVCHILMANVLLLISYIYQYIIYLERTDEYIQIIIIRQLSQQQKQHKCMKTHSLFCYIMFPYLKFLVWQLYWPDQPPMPHELWEEVQ